MADPLRIIFAGTPDFAVPCLHACHGEGMKCVAVLTQPDRRAGRGRKLQASPVKQAALEAGLTVEQPESMKTRQAYDMLATYQPDLLVVVAYGQLLPQAILDVPQPWGCWNVHASLLPRWRGAAPIQRAIAAGDTRTGVCLMQMEAGLDTGPILLQRETAITDKDTGGSVHDRLAQLGSEVLAEGLKRVRRNSTLIATGQSEQGITYAHKLTKAESCLDTTQSASVLERTIRAFNPWPTASIELDGERVRIWQAEVLEAENPSLHHAPGSIIAVGKQGIDIACSPGILRIQQLQRPGGRRIHARDYLNARPQLRQSV